MNIMIVAGGTGGHIFPAVVFGHFAETKLCARVSYLAGNRPLEREIYASLGLEPLELPLSGSPLGVSSFRRRLARCLDLVRAFWETGKILKREKPDLCFLFGGYISFAPLLFCLLKKIPVVVHEQNATAGRVTRLSARLGGTVAAGWRECAGVDGRFVSVGVPVRPPEKLERRTAMRALGLNFSRESRVVGVIGGSLGSRPLMEKVTEAAKRFQDVSFVVLGDGRPGEERPATLHFVGRQWDVRPFYSLCDFLICRAGASTLAEAMAWELPTLAVPWRGAADGHQERNARNFAALTGNSVGSDDGTDDFDKKLQELLERGRKPSAWSFGKDACADLWSEGLQKLKGRRTGDRKQGSF